VIQLSDVHKAFRVKDRKSHAWKRIEAVRGLSFTVRPGEIYGLLGPNGAGKSTTLRMIAGLMRPDSGHITVCGIDTQERPEESRSLVGYLATDIGVYTRFTPRELLRIFGEFQGLDPKVAERRGIALLERLHLLDFADIRMEGFSSGQKQKVSIARALLHEPKVVIFDEPTTGLDVFTAKIVLDLLRTLKSEGRAVIVSTHAMPMVEDICDRVGILFDGELHGDAPPTEMLEHWQVHGLEDVFFKLAAR
jgi:sodium transport system ATP-binding protein